MHPNEIESLRLNVEMQHKLGVNVRLIDRQELQELEPDWRVDEVESRRLRARSGYGDGDGVANDFLGASSRIGRWPTCRAPRRINFFDANGRMHGVRH